MGLTTLPTYSYYESRPIFKCYVLKCMQTLFSDFFVYEVFVCNFFTVFERKQLSTVIKSSVNSIKVKT